MSRFNCKVKGRIVGYGFPVENNKIMFSIYFVSEENLLDEKEYKKPITEEQYKNYSNILYENYGKKL